MIYYNNCDCRQYWSEFFIEYKAQLMVLLKKIFSKELYGNPNVYCDYNKLNDTMYAKENESILLNIERNNNECESMNIETNL